MLAVVVEVAVSLSCSFTGFATKIVVAATALGVDAFAALDAVLPSAAATARSIRCASAATVLSSCSRLPFRLRVGRGGGVRLCPRAGLKGPLPLLLVLSLSNGDIAAFFDLRISTRRDSSAAVWRACSSCCRPPRSVVLASMSRCASLSTLSARRI